MASQAPHRSYGPKSSIRTQKRFVPKTTTAAPTAPPGSSSSRDHPISDEPSPPPPALTTVLRGSSAQSSRFGEKGSRPRLGDGGIFVSYLPQDEAVASGVGAEGRGLDAEESQQAVDLLNDELSRILKMSPKDFWREVATNESLHEFLDSYLQFRHRWYDLPHHGARGTVAGVIFGDLELCRRVFMVLYRISSNRDPGAKATDCLTMKDHTALLQEKQLLDLPKLLDICAIYGHENGELTALLVTNAIKAQATLPSNISSVVSHFLTIVHTMHERCISSMQVLSLSAAHEELGLGRLYKDFLEVIDFINDAVVTLDGVADAYKPAVICFSGSFNLSYGNDELLSSLVRLHDSLLPSLQRGFMLLSNASASGQLNISGSDAFLSLSMLSIRIVKFGWKLLDRCYLSSEFIDDSLLQTSMKMFPVNVDDPAIRGDIVVQALREINGEAFYDLENHTSGSFLQNIEKNHNILSRITSLRSNGWISMDEDQFQYLFQIATPPLSKSSEKVSSLPVPSLAHKVQNNEDHVILESKISQIRDIFPEYGKGFLSACLEVYNKDPEEVIQRILEGTLHKDLLSLDTSSEQIPQQRPASTAVKDKGKGVLLEAPSESTPLPLKRDPSVPGKAAEGPSTASVSSSYGRYTRKSNNDLPESQILDSKAAKDSLRTAVLAAEHEYEDEYDDSFDDLGLSVFGSGLEETENLTDRINSLPGKTSGSEADGSSRSSSSKWGSQKKTQFYVKDGKNYSYKVSGSIAVNNAQEADLINQAQKDLIYGLGRGGNLPLGAVQKLAEAEELNHEDSDAPENSGRGTTGFRGRGGRRGGGNHYRKDRAMKKHFQGLGSY